MFVGTLNQKPNPESFHLNQKRVSNLQRHKQSRRALPSQVQHRKVTNTSDKVMKIDEKPLNHVEKVAQVAHKQSTRVKKQRMRENRLSVHSTPDLFDQNKRNTSSRRNSHHLQVSPSRQIGVMPSQVKLSSSPPHIQSTSGIKVETPFGYKIGSIEEPNKVPISQISTSKNSKSFVTNQQSSSTLGINSTTDSNSNISSIKEMLTTNKMKKNILMDSFMQEIQTKLTDQMMKTVNELLDSKLQSQKEDLEKSFISNIQSNQQMFENNITSHLGALENNVQLQIDSIRKETLDRLSVFDEVIKNEISRKMDEMHVDLEHKINERVKQSMIDIQNTINNNLELLNQNKTELKQWIESLHQEIDTQKKSFCEQVMSDFDQEIQKHKTELESHLKVTLQTNFDERINIERGFLTEEIKKMIESILSTRDTPTTSVQQETTVTSNQDQP